MVTREILKSEIEKVPSERLEELYQVVRSFTTAARAPTTKNFMTRLREIEIDGPEDFAVNVDRYLNGEKGVD